MSDRQEVLTAAVRAIAEQLAGIVEESFRRHLEAASKEGHEGMGPMDAAAHVVAEAIRRATDDAGLEAGGPRKRASADAYTRAWRMRATGAPIKEIIETTGVGYQQVVEMGAMLETLTGSREPNERVADLTWEEARAAVADALGVPRTVGNIYTMRKVAEEQRQGVEEAEQRRNRVFLNSSDWTATDTALRPKEEEE